MAKTLTAATLLSSQSNAAGATVRSAVLDCRSIDGGEIRLRITNGATGPTVQCTARVLVARTQGSVPVAAAEGTGDNDWKLVGSIGGSTVNNGSNRGVYRIPPGVGFVHIEFSGNTGQAVTVEATGETFTY
jgi:hypothetical protein